MTFDGYAPKYKIGCLQPGEVIDNQPFEFYRLAPPGVMLVMVGVGLKEFSSQDVERVFAPLDRYLGQLMERGRRSRDPERRAAADPDRHRGARPHGRVHGKYTGRPATTTVLSVVRAAASSASARSRSSTNGPTR